MLDRIIKVEPATGEIHPLHRVTLFNVTAKAEYVAYWEPERLKAQQLKEEILSLVGEVLWDSEIEKRIEELLEIEYTRGHYDGHEAGFENGRDSG
jgi:hypothetical protein